MIEIYSNNILKKCKPFISLLKIEKKNINIARWASVLDLKFSSGLHVHVEETYVQGKNLKVIINVVIK